MFEPTVSNLYYLMKDMAVKPSIFEDTIYTERAFHRGYSFSTILNKHKDFVITQQYSNQFRIVLTRYAYSVWIPFNIKQSKVFIVKKYA